MGLMNLLRKKIEIQEEELEKETKKYLVQLEEGLAIKWEELYQERLNTEDSEEIYNRLLVKVLGSELTAQNVSGSYIISDGNRVFSPRNSDGEPYSFKNKDRAIIYAEVIGFDKNQVYGNS
jgi:hypothetical protein